MRLSAIERQVVTEIAALADVGGDRAPIAAVPACCERRLIVLISLFEQPVLVAAGKLEFETAAKHGRHGRGKRPAAQHALIEAGVAIVVDGRRHSFEQAAIKEKDVT